jgi:ABC-2 type transport system permease protein
MAASSRVPLRHRWSAALAEARIRLLHMTRYPGQLALEIVIPLIFAAMPMILGRAIPGGDPAARFEANTGTANYVAFLLVGSTAFVIVTRAFTDIASWLRFEQETGTLEAVYLTPTSAVTLATGVALYSAARSTGTGLVAYLLGSLVFQVNPLEGNVLLAFAFILVGLTPVYAMAFLFGALVIKVKESNELVAVMQWLVCFLMGVYFPVAVLPPLARGLALAFPPTWMVNGVRSALLDVGYFFGTWYADLAVLWVFLLLTPMLSVWLFRRVERNIRRHEGMGAF